MQTIRCATVVLALALSASVWTACEQPEVRDEHASTGEVDEARNELTDAEREAGWELLFDGDDLGRWKGYGSDETPSGWIVDGGLLHFDPDVEGAGGDLLTKETFGDFEFAFEWKISECGNSGVIYRAVDTAEYETPWMTGPEYQVLDDACYDGGNLTGSNYDMHPPSEQVNRPAGEWNSGRIVADAARVEHWLNGTKVVEYELWSDEWEARKAESKWSEYPDYGMARSGHIALQDHGNPVWYRKLRIRPLE